MQFLKSTQDGEDRMLDNTMILFGSGMNSGEDGDHSPKNQPLLVTREVSLVCGMVSIWPSTSKKVFLLRPSILRWLKRWELKQKSFQMRLER